MKERPILFSGEMARAILENRKTQTRRVMRPQPTPRNNYTPTAWEWKGFSWLENNMIDSRVLELCPYGGPGDLLYVREAHLLDPPIDGTWDHLADTYDKISDIPERYRVPEYVIYRADGKLGDEWNWRPSIHMPKWAARLWLEVEDVRVERLHKIEPAGIIAEGIRTTLRGYDAERDLYDQFRELWGSLNTKRGYGWNANPWVFVIEFARGTR